MATSEAIEKDAQLQFQDICSLGMLAERAEDLNVGEWHFTEAAWAPLTASRTDGLLTCIIIEKKTHFC